MRRASRLTVSKRRIGGEGIGRCGVRRGGGAELDLPLGDAGAGGGGFSLGHEAGGLERDGERGVGEGIVWGERGEGHGRGDGLVELACVAEGADEAVMGLDEAEAGGVLAEGDGFAEGVGGRGGRTGGEQIEAALAEGFGGGNGVGHGVVFRI